MVIAEKWLGAPMREAGLSCCYVADAATKSPRLDFAIRQIEQKYQPLKYNSSNEALSHALVLAHS